MTSSTCTNLRWTAAHHNRRAARWSPDSARRRPRTDRGPCCLPGAGDQVADVEPEGAVHAIGTRLGDVDRAGARPAPDPAQLVEPAQQPGSERAGQVMALLAPVHAVADERPSASGRAVNANVLEHGAACAGQLIGGVPAR